LLRGINVSGHRKVAMPELRALCETIGFANVSSYLMSGNVVLESDLPADEVRQRLSTAVHDAFHHDDVDVAVLGAGDLDRVLAACPKAMGDGAGWHFTFLIGKPAEDAKAGLSGDEYAPDQYFIGDGVVYVHCPNGYGRTKINNSFFERKLKVRATTRNWKTVNTLKDRPSLLMPVTAMSSA
jgi:uncharacterized protein (DUF1697 family)